MSDKLVFDLAQEVEGSPNVFIRKDWLNILDNQNQNYNNNQSVLDTSQLSNSNKYMSYREAYLSIPLLVTVATNGFDTNINPPTATAAGFDPLTAATSADYCVGLKNWFGQIIHSFTLDYNGTTIVQQTPFINMWNSFKLMTSLSYNDIITQGPTIGFYPDDPTSWTYNLSNVITLDGPGVANNTNYKSITPVSGAFNKFDSGSGNLGFLNRQQLINFDALGVVGNGAAGPNGDGTYGGLLFGTTSNAGNDGTLNSLWKSYISNRRIQTVNAGAQTTAGYIQYSIVATVYLKHIHSFFNMCPLLKGVFMKMTMNLNNTSTSFACTSESPGPGASDYAAITYTLSSVSNPLGGVNPLMIASARADNGGASLFPYVGQLSVGGAGDTTLKYIANVSVGATILDSTVNSLVGQSGSLSRSIYLYVPAYTFNPVFEQAYLSSPIKSIKYTDVYQYQVLQVPTNGNINNLLTNGIANVKSVLVLPFYSSGVAGNTQLPSGMPVWQSPFDPAGTGPTSPLAYITNFNIQVSGQNAIYNLEKYNFEQFNNQLYGQNSVNGGLTDGITSGLVSRQHFDMEYCYYYVNVERMLPVEQSVPKSIQLIGQNLSSKTIDYICFIEYGNSIDLDILTGARV